MISKRIHCKKENDNYRRLAEYIADASHKGEKSLVSWCAGAWADDDYDLAIQEVMDTQSLNMRTTKEKTYHLVISFRTEDEGKLNEDDYKAIEERFAKALGFEEHQRHCGVHKNTDNLHMHIAYNMINPDTLSRHEPYRDYKTLNNLCREIEKEYNLAVDNGIEEGADLKLKESSRRKEVLTGEESFERFVLSLHDNILESIEKAQNWQDVHDVFGLFGLELKKSGNGLVIKNRKGKERIKASSLDRNLSHRKLTEIFGNFISSSREVKAKDWYRKKPLHVDYSSELWKEFLKQSKEEEIERIKEKWLKEKIRITGLVVDKKTQRELQNKAKLQERLEINSYKQDVNVKSKHWIDFLQAKANEGDEEALAVLRSRKDVVLPDTLNIKAFGKGKAVLLRQKELTKIKHDVLTADISRPTKKILLGVRLLQSVAEDEFSHKITRNGGLLFTLKDGSKIIDNGKTIAFTDKAKNLALDYANAKFGLKEFTPKMKEAFVGNQVDFAKLRDLSKQGEKDLGR